MIKYYCDICKKKVRELPMMLHYPNVNTDNTDKTGISIVVKTTRGKDACSECLFKLLKKVVPNLTLYTMDKVRYKNEKNKN